MKEEVMFIITDISADGDKLKVTGFTKRYIGKTIKIHEGDAKLIQEI